MKKINAVFFVLFITLIIGCSSDDKSLVGKWNGTDQIGTVQTFNFIDSENIEWTISNDHFDLTEKGVYSGSTLDNILVLGSATIDNNMTSGDTAGVTVL
ncbi:MAG: hypothetical protein KKD86_03980, partial [Bacteroidetes bacterium]|nr:hypothetical protein [Bacteroidota bacterium]